MSSQHPPLDKDGSRDEIREGVSTQSGRDAVLRIRVGRTVADTQQRVPTIEIFHSFSRSRGRFTEIPNTTPLKSHLGQGGTINFNGL